MAFAIDYVFAIKAVLLFLTLKLDFIPFAYIWISMNINVVVALFVATGEDAVALRSCAAWGIIFH